MLSLSLHKMVASHSELLMADHQHQSSVKTKQNNSINRHVNTHITTALMLPKHSAKSDVNMTCHFKGRLLYLQLDI